MRHAMRLSVLLNFPLMRHAMRQDHRFQRHLPWWKPSLEVCRRTPWYPCTKCSSSGKEFYIWRTEDVSWCFQHCTQTLDRSWKSLKDFLLAHMVLKHKDRGHSTMHPSVTQYVFMWCWRCTLNNPDPQRFLEELEALVGHSRGIKTCQVEYFENSHKPQKW